MKAFQRVAWMIFLSMAGVSGGAWAGYKVVIPTRTFHVLTADGKAAVGVPIQYSLQVKKFGFYLKAPTPIPLPQWRSETVERRVYTTQARGELVVPEQVFQSRSPFVKEAVFRVEFPQWQTQSVTAGMTVSETHQIEGEFILPSGERRALWLFTAEEGRLQSDLAQFPNPLQMTLSLTLEELDTKLRLYQQYCSGLLARPKK